MAAHNPLKSDTTRRGERTEILMFMPSVILLALISIFPLAYIIYISFMDFTISVDSPVFVGLNNWVRVLTDDVFWSSWGRTVLYAGFGLLVEMIVGIGVALVVFQLPKGRNLVLTLWMLPLFVAPVVAGLLGRFLLNSTYGLYAWFLQLLNVKVELLGDVSTAMAAVIAIDVWEWTPLITIIVLAALQSMPQEAVEAADIDGAHYGQKLRLVVLPMVAQPILVALLVRSMDIMRFVDVIKISTEGGPANSTKIVGYRLMEVAFRFQDFGAAAAIGITMLIVTIVLGKLFVRLLMKGGVG